MSRQPKEYIIEYQCRGEHCSPALAVDHNSTGCPQDQMLTIRKNLGAAYLELAKEYIDSLDLSQSEKDYISHKVIQNFQRMDCHHPSE